MITQDFSMRFAAVMALCVLGAPLSHGTESPAPSQASLQQQMSDVARLSASAQALRAEMLRAFGEDSKVANYYAGRDFTPIWLAPDGSATDAATALVVTLGNAANHALPEAKYRGRELAVELGAPSWRTEAGLTQAFLAYAQDVGSGLLTPREVDRELHVYPERRPIPELLNGAAGATDITAYLATLEPQGVGYAELRSHYNEFRARVSNPIWGSLVPNGRTLRPGDRNSRVRLVRDRLIAKGDLDPDIYRQGATMNADGTRLAINEVTTDVPQSSFEPDLFDDQLLEAVQRFQARHGLNQDGVVGPATLRQLNTSSQTRAEQIAVNLERMRWLNRDLGDRHIMVNLAGFSMELVNNGQIELSSRVVVGKARKHRTPEFSDVMTHMVINPSWYVPTSIANEELLPKLETDPNYLENRGIRITSSGRLVQSPGAGNALGTVKFMFPNRFAIYLHDTPSKRLFGRDVRAYSHGCVRVEKPHELAAQLLSTQEADPAGYFSSVLGRGRERRVDLREPVPVHLTYRSAWIDQGGEPQFRGDVYGRDLRIAEALKGAGVSIK